MFLGRTTVLQQSHCQLQTLARDFQPATSHTNCGISTSIVNNSGGDASSPETKSGISDSKGELRALYLDAQATTALDPRVLDAMMPYLTHQYGNPHSRTHLYGWETEAAVENARQVCLSSLMQ